MSRANMGAKLLEAEQLHKKASKLWAPSLMEFRLKPDWEGAAPLFEKAALAFKQAGQLEKARGAYEQAAQSQEKLGSCWHAGKHLETCAALSKDLGQLGRVGDYARQAGGMYAAAGRMSAAADALARGAKVLEEAAPEDASSLYAEALEMYENDGKEAQAGDVFRSAVSLLVRRAAWADAVSTLLRFGEACEKGGAVTSQAKAYLGAVVAWLAAGQPQAAWAVFQDVLGVDGFQKSDEAFAADALFSAYAGGEAASIQAVVQSKACFKHMDASLARLALKLPQGPLAEQARVLAAVMGGRDPNKSEAEQEADELL